MKIPIAAITLDGSTQARAGLDGDHVERLRESLRRGDTLPEVVLYFDGDAYWPGDGLHRIDARKGEGLTHVDADVRQGTHGDAILYAVGCNDTHGLPRSNDDKRHAVKLLLGNPLWEGHSDRWIADQCRVSDRFVGNVRASNSTANGSQLKGGKGKNTEKRKGRDGKTRSMPAKKEGPCARCLRTGVPSCPACRAKFPEGFPREPGSDDPDDHRPRSRNGKPLYRWKDWESAWGKSVREFDNIAKAFKDTESPEHDRASKAMDVFTASFKAWKLRLVKA